MNTWSGLLGEGTQHRFLARPMTWISMGMLIVMMLAGLAACGGGSTSSSGGNGPVNLTYALWDQNEQVGYQQSVNQFMKLHPNIHVTIEQTPWGSYWQKLSTEFAAGNAPDVFWDHLAYFPTFVQQGQLMDLTPLIQQDKIDMSQYYPTLVSEWTYNNKVYGLPKDWDTIAVIYNKQLFKQAGLPDPTSMTWNPTDGGTFLQMAQKLTIDKNGKHPTDPGFDAKGGHAAMVTGGSWELSSIAQQTKIPWAVAQLPAGPNGVTSVFNGLTDAIYVKTPHPNEAWELEKWLASAQSEDIMGNGGYVWPGLKSEDQTFLQSWQKKGIDVSPFLKEAQGSTLTFPITFGYNEASTKVNDIFNQMYLGQLTVPQATSQAVQQANQAVQAASTGG